MNISYGSTLNALVYAEYRCPVCGKNNSSTKRPIHFDFVRNAVHCGCLAEKGAA